MPAVAVCGWKCSL